MLNKLNLSNENENENKNENDILNNAFAVLKEDGIPSEQQKEIMLNRIMMECKAENTCSIIGKLKKLLFVYPWRFAFIASSVQALLCTMIFGTQYTNLVLGFFGG